MMTNNSRSTLSPGTLKLLPCESLEQFNAFAHSVWQHYQPANAYEEMLTNFVVITSWRYRRYLAMEESVVAEEARIAGKRPSAQEDPSKDSTSILSTMWKDKESAESLKLVLRHVAAARRDANNAVANLRRVQEERLTNFTSRTERAESLAQIAELPVSAVESEAQRGRCRTAVEDRSTSLAVAGRAPFCASPSEEASLDVPHQIRPEPVAALSRTERRALERRLRKAEKKALRNAPANGQVQFVSHAA